ncbi:hypothetical protein XENTR_v10009333 [Xenopus tropicalis]|uniref:tubulin-glutamate carboxypeptidase n=1 Tax=Xenopus tropicalis TaxID=8364 RepID=F6QLJ5_XENTR|nr:cytosolic carboxypeptidase 4 [Xenopus tropicalis]KAE8618250.1 hypothetical protein XENTR_v10009333 [Xenopus tropicalis]|eukprot:XP_002933362.2 PREDICTED: cytosolic carboxypeptidase 4 [Xenopus tropicalis]
MATEGASEGASGLQVLLSTLQNSYERDVTLNIISVLSELLSAGTQKRIHYMISKGGSEALLQTLVNLARSDSLDYSLLVPLLTLLVKVGKKDGKFGEKAQKLEATDVTLSLARKNLTKLENLTPCILALQVYASNVSAGAMLGINGALELLFKVICPYTRRHTQTIKAAIEAFAALLKSKSNGRRAVNRGYVNSLLQFYKDWHLCDSSNRYIHIRRGLIRCLKHITNIRSGREAFRQAKGMEIVFSTTQECLQCNSLDSLVNAAIQVLRKCCPKCPLPLSVIKSSYTFHIPGITDISAPPKSYPQEDESEDEEETEMEGINRNEVLDKEEDDDLETDLNKLKSRPKADRDEKELEHYKIFFPERYLDLQDLHSENEEVKPNAGNICVTSHANAHNILAAQRIQEDCCGKSITGEKYPSWTHFEKEILRAKCNRLHLLEAEATNSLTKTSCELNHTRNPSASPSASSGYVEPTSLPNKCTKPFKVKQGDWDESQNHAIVNQLLEQHKGNIPFHEPHLYMANAEKTKSVPDYKVLAFPDFWGHHYPSYSQPLADKKFGSQRYKILEDIQRHLKPADLINRTVFDLENPSVLESCEKENCLKFYSKFESGNLRKVIQVREFEYDLIMNADVNTDQHHQWFYFEVSAMKANVPYRFNVINCEKVNSQFNYGMQPVLYSVKDAICGKNYWVRTGYDICYYKNLFCYRASDEKKKRRRRYYTLSFTQKFPHMDDVCYLAYHFPYTFTALMSHLELLQQRHNSKTIYFKQQTLCHTLGGNACPLVTITAMPSAKRRSHYQELRSRQYMVLTARVHPGESNASWVMKGTLEFLTSNDPIAEILREMFIFKIVPMLNPDGVINGNHRCSLNGEDLNRQWMSPKSHLQPTIYHLKGLLYHLNSINKTPLVFCDYHGHSQRKNVFFYGCSIKETLWQAGCVVDSSTLLEDVGYRSLPKILDKIAPAFSMANSSFLVEKARESTARVVVWHEIGVLRSYTMESTYCGFNQGAYKGLQVGTKELEEMGAKFCLGLLVLQSKTLYSTSLLPQVEALIEAERECAEYQRTSNADTDDEPLCAEEIDYNTESFSDEEAACSDSEMNSKEKFSDNGYDTARAGAQSSNVQTQHCSSKSKDAMTKSLAKTSKQHGCCPEAGTSHYEQGYDCTSKQQMGRCLY